MIARADLTWAGVVILAEDGTVIVGQGRGGTVLRFAGDALERQSTWSLRDSTSGTAPSAGWDRLFITVRQQGNAVHSLEPPTGDSRLVFAADADECISAALAIETGAAILHVSCERGDHAIVLSGELEPVRALPLGHHTGWCAVGTSEIAVIDRPNRSDFVARCFSLDGTEKWKTTLAGTRHRGSHPPILDASGLYVVSIDGDATSRIHVVKLGRNGGPNWSHVFDSRGYGQPFVAGDGAFYLALVDELVRIESDGSHVWTGQMRFVSPPLSDREGVIYGLAEFAGNEFALVALAPDGSLVFALPGRYEPRAIDARGRLIAIRQLSPSRKEVVAIG